MGGGRGSSHGPATGSDLTRAGGGRDGTGPAHARSRGRGPGQRGLLSGAPPRGGTLGAAGKKCGAPQPPTRAEAGKGQDGGVSAPPRLRLRVEGGVPPSPGPQQSPRGGGLPGAGPPRRWGLGGGTDFTPLPLRPRAVQGTPRPRAPGRRVGEAAEPPGALQRRGEEGRSAHGRMGARPPPPTRRRAPAGPPALKGGRARAPKGGGGRGWQGRGQTPGL